MKKASLVLLGALVAALLAATASAHRGLPGDGGRVVKAAPPPLPTSAEATGTVTEGADGGSITITAANGSAITCAVPAGLDLTPFLSGQVKAECQLVDGVLTLRELEAANGAKVEIGEDEDVEVVENEDENEAEVGDVEDNSGPGSVNSGPGSDEDHGGPGGGDHDGGGGGDHGGSGGGDD